jgi:hypothetical protein
MRELFNNILVIVHLTVILILRHGVLDKFLMQIFFFLIQDTNTSKIANLDKDNACPY